MKAVRARFVLLIKSGGAENVATLLIPSRFHQDPALQDRPTIRKHGNPLLDAKSLVVGTPEAKLYGNPPSLEHHPWKNADRDQSEELHLPIDLGQRNERKARCHNCSHYQIQEANLTDRLN